MEARTAMKYMLLSKIMSNQPKDSSRDHQGSPGLQQSHSDTNWSSNWSFEETNTIISSKSGLDLRKVETGEKVTSALSAMSAFMLLYYFSFCAFSHLSDVLVNSSAKHTLTYALTIRELYVFYRFFMFDTLQGCSMWDQRSTPWQQSPVRTRQAEIGM